MTLCVCLGHIKLVSRLRPEIQASNSVTICAVDNLLSGVDFGRINLDKWPNQLKSILYFLNTPGTAGGPGGRDRTLAVKSKKIAKKSFFLVK